MRPLEPAAAAAFAAGEVTFCGALRVVLPAETVQIWEGRGVLAVAGLGDFVGVPIAALRGPAASAIGGAAGGRRLRLSPLEPVVAQRLLGQPLRGAKVTLWRLVLAPSSATVLGALRVTVGRFGAPELTETIGGPSALEIPIEDSALDLSRRGARTRSDADQRLLGGPNDASFAAIATSGEKTLSWGAAPPAAAASALPGAVAPGGRVDVTGRPGVGRAF